MAGWARRSLAGCEVKPVASEVKCVCVCVKGGCLYTGNPGQLFEKKKKKLYYLGLCQAEIRMENTQDLRRQVPRTRKIHPRRIQATGLDSITLCSVGPQSGDADYNGSTPV